MKDTLTGLTIGAIVVILLYFMWHLPEVNKAYEKGKQECLSSNKPDTLYLKGKDSIVVHDHIVYKSTPVDTPETVDEIAAGFDTLLFSGHDTINIQTDVAITNGIAEWVMNVHHADYTPSPDTVKINKLIEVMVPVEKTNWLTALIAYAGGILSALTIILLN